MFFDVFCFQTAKLVKIFTISNIVFYIFFKSKFFLKIFVFRYSDVIFLMADMIFLFLNSIVE